jgi:hypothetical protein
MSLESGSVTILEDGMSSKRGIIRSWTEKEDIVGLISEKISSGDVTLVFGAKDEKVNNAVALKEYLLREP